jgi:hypothetical protein
VSRSVPSSAERRCDSRTAEAARACRMAARLSSKESSSTADRMAMGRPLDVTTNSRSSARRRQVSADWLLSSRTVKNFTLGVYHTIVTTIETQSSADSPQPSEPSFRAVMASIQPARPFALRKAVSYPARTAPHSPEWNWRLEARPVLLDSHQRKESRSLAEAQRKRRWSGSGSGAWEVRAAPKGNLS